MIDAQYNTFYQVLAHYHTCGKVSLTQKETKATIPTLDHLIEANLNIGKQPKELTARLKHEDEIYYIKADIDYFPLFDREIEESLEVTKNLSILQNSNSDVVQPSKPSISYMVWVKQIWR